jgi:hypothetical protein
MFTGNLSLDEHAMIHNWFENVVSGAAQVKSKWLQCVPFAHAITLVICHRNQALLLTEQISTKRLSVEQQAYLLLQKAWELQVGQNPPPSAADVNREVLSLLEHHMFETSKAAGPAGYQQWGLEVGMHQQRWSPYPHVPEEWNLGDIAEAEEEEYTVSLSCFSGRIDTHNFSI